MSISRRTQYLGIYAYSDTGTEGVPVDTWTFQEAAWGRVDDTKGQQVQHGGVTESRVDAVIQFDEYADIPANCIVVDGSSIDAATAYHVRAVTPRQLMRVQLAYAERIDRNKIDPSALILDGTWVIDGSEILNGVRV